MRAAIYARQSLNVPEGIERQTERTVKLVRERGWTLGTQYLDNDTSASKARGAKTDWARMLRDAEAGEFDVLVALNLDRLIRTQRDLVTLIDLGVKVVTVEGDLDLASASGEMQASVITAMARFEVRRKGERQRRASEQRAAKGVPFAGGRRAFGWQPGNTVADPEERRWVVWMHEQLLAGTPLQQITRTLNQEGVTTTLGNTWTAMQVKSILRRERNAGVLVFRGEVMPQSQIEPLVDMETHRAALSVLAPGHRNPRREDSWLSGIIKCSCGAPMNAKLIHRKGKEPQRSYVCGAALKATKQGIGPGVAGRGHHSSVPAHLAELKAMNTIFDRINSGTLASENEHVAADVKRLSAKLTDLAADAATWTEAFGLPGADKVTVRSKLALIERERESTQRQLDNLRFTAAGASWLMNQGKNVWESVSGFYDWWQSRTLTERQNVARSLDMTVALGRGGMERVQVA